MYKSATLLGFAKAGKTTYLAALWQSLRAGDCPLAYKVEALPEDRAYLARIADDWLKANEMPRTRVGVPQHVDLTLTAAANGDQFSLHVPDISGEVFEQQLQDRYFSPELSKMLVESSGFLFFINPGSVNTAGLIEEGLIVSDQLKALARASESGPPPVEKEETAATATQTQTKPWDFSCVGSDAAVVELMQAVDFARRDVALSKVSVVISAWDLVDAVCESPDAYLEQYLPLFSQYIHGNQNWPRYSLFGVSAQGGDYSKPDEKTKLLHMQQPWKRVRVTSSAPGDFNILSPLLDAISST